MATRSQREKELRRKIQILNNKKAKTEAEIERALNEIADAFVELCTASIVGDIGNSFGELVINTPVDTGRARAGWQIEASNNQKIPPKGVYEKAKGDNPPIIEERQEQLERLAIKGAKEVFIINNVEYILALEAFGGKYKRPGFIALFLETLQRRIADGVAKLNRG